MFTFSIVFGGYTSYTAFISNAPISPRIVFFQSAQSGPDCPRSIIFLIGPIVVLYRLQLPLFLTRLSPDQWTIVEGRLSDVPHAIDTFQARFRAGIRQRPDKDPLLARKIAIFGHCSAKNRRSRLERARFLPLCGRFLPFFSRFWCESGRECAFDDAGGRN